MAAKPYSRSEFATGFVVLALIGTGIFLAAKYGDVERFWGPRQEVLVVFDNIGSLQKDSPVRYNGMEVGRVKALRIVHLDEKVLEDRFPELTRASIDNLPLRPDDLKRALKEKPDGDLNTLIKRSLAGRTMIELSLDVMLGDDFKRYRSDDHCRIVTTVFGDSSVEIISGSGPVIQSSQQLYLIGLSGDFFSNLQKSMGEVKTILSGVSDVIGTSERRSFSRSQDTYNRISKRLASVTALADERMPATMKRFSALPVSAKSKLAEVTKNFEAINPHAQESVDTVRAGLKDVQDRFDLFQKEAMVTITDLSAEADKLQEALKKPLADSKADFIEMKARLASLSVSFERVSGRMTTAGDVASSMLLQSEDDLGRFGVAAKNSIDNLKIAAYVANENKDLMLSRRDVGEYEYFTAQDIYRKLQLSLRRMREALADASDAATDAELEAPASLAARLQQASLKVMEARENLEPVRDRIEERMIPPFNRKGTYWPRGQVDERTEK